MTDEVKGSAAAPMSLPAPDLTGEELVRASRERARQRPERIRKRIFSAIGVVAIGGSIATATLIHQGPRFSVVTTLVFVGTFAILARIVFEAGNGIFLPTQLALVPMLFALPLGAVPAVVIASLIVSRAWRAFKRRSLTPLLPQFGNAMHVFGPVLVLAAAHGLPLRWSAWPIYVAALCSEFAIDLVVSIVRELGDPIKLRTILGLGAIAYSVDAALAPIGLAVAFATRDHPALVVIVLPLAALLRYFGRERQRRIDHALELSDAYRGTAFLLGDLIEADDTYTGSHSRDVVELVRSVCDRLDIDPAARREAEFVALLHDVGKIRMPAEIINKPGPLDSGERAIIETHTIEGEQLLNQVGGLLGHIGGIVRSCHEHWDGRGYPDRLVGDRIPLVARIVCACDAYNAMTTDRPYRRARLVGEALAELERCAGTQFDPAVVDALVAAVKASLSAATEPVSVAAR